MSDSRTALPRPHAAAASPIEASAQSNKLGTIRLALAFLVLVSHASELVDGNRSRELLTRIFGTLSLGEAAVDGFFLVSGYLILQSVQRSRTAAAFLGKRILRIVPGFVVAYLLTLFVVAPLAGGDLRTLLGPAGWDALLRMGLLLGPKLDGAFAGLPDPQLNSAMWTIAYEFRCYILALALGLAGVLDRPRLYLALTAATALLFLSKLDPALPPPVAALTGHVNATARFVTAFLVGGAFHLFRSEMPPYTDRAALAAAAVAAGMLFSPWFAEIGHVVFGGYVLFWFALASPPSVLNQVGRKQDISYGLYLYAWPVQNALIWFWPGATPIGLLCLSAPVAAGLGYASWRLVESPALRLKPRGTRSRPPPR